MSGISDSWKLSPAPPATGWGGGGHSEKTAVCEPGSGPCPTTASLDLILDSQPSPHCLPPGQKSAFWV